MEASGAPHWPPTNGKEAGKQYSKKGIVADQWAAQVRKADVSWPEPLTSRPKGHHDPEFYPVLESRNGMEQQQQNLAYLMQRVEHLQHEAADKDAFATENLELQQRLEEMELALMRKDKELKHAHQQEALAQQMSARIDDVFREFEQFQQKVNAFETQSSKATVLGLQLEELQQSYQYQQKDLVRKQLKVEELTAENHRLRSELSLMEERLADVSVQRQQLVKKSQLLQEANIEAQSFPEGKGKLDKDLRRLGELESMLKQMDDERLRLQGWRKNNLG
jgi:chromosome segregation ATPase